MVTTLVTMLMYLARDVSGSLWMLLGHRRKQGLSDGLGMVVMLGEDVAGGSDRCDWRSSGRLEARAATAWAKASMVDGRLVAWWLPGGAGEGSGESCRAAGAAGAKVA